MTVQEKLDFAIDYLKKQDLASLEVGKYQVNDYFYYSIQEYETKLHENCKLESHEQYADIQIVISGEEGIDICPVAGLERETEYNAEKDFSLWKTPAVMAHSELKNGSFAVYTPEIAHKPGMCVGSPSHVKKCVGKVKVK